jgi:hypothetical protein
MSTEGCALSYAKMLMAEATAPSSLPRSSRPLIGASLRGTRAEIVEFAASARTTTEEAAAGIDPWIAERMISGVFEDVNMHDVPGQVTMETQLLLLAALISEAMFTASDLDVFVADSRKLANRWII